MRYIAILCTALLIVVAGCAQDVAEMPSQEELADTAVDSEPLVGDMQMDEVSEVDALSEELSASDLEEEFNDLNPDDLENIDF